MIKKILRFLVILIILVVGIGFLAYLYVDKPAISWPIST